MNAGTQLPGNGGPSEESLRPNTIMGNFYSLFPSLAMLAGMKLELFTPLKDGPMTARALAEALKVRENKLTPLLYLLVTAGLLKMENNSFSNTEEAHEFLVNGRPNYIGGQNAFFTSLLEIGLKSAESVKSGQPQAKHDFQDLSEEELLAYFRRQVHSSLAAGREIAEKLDFSQFQSLLDAGGGSGGVAMAICRQYPRLKASVADLPKVAKLAKLFIDEAGLADRINVTPADLCSEPLTGKYDAAILRALIQTLSKAEAQKCLKFVGQAMSPGGRIFIFGNVMDDSHLGPPAALAFSLVFLNTYDDGQAYTEKEYRQMLTEAGFAGISVEHGILGDGGSLVSAVKG